MLAPGERLVGMPIMIAATALGGFLGPFVTGALRAATGGFGAAFWCLGGAIIIAAAMVAAFPSRWAAPGSEEAARGAAAGARRRAAAAAAAARRRGSAEPV
jgi:glutathione S-transferase